MQGQQFLSPRDFPPELENGCFNPLLIVALRPLQLLMDKNSASQPSPSRGLAASPVERGQELLLGIALLALLLLVFWVYKPGISGPLVLDDLWNLQPLGEGGGVDSFSQLRKFLFDNNSGPTGRPVAMASFLLDAQDWPASIAAFKYTNILIHLLTGTLLFWFSALLAETTGLGRLHALQVGLLVAALWLLHPLNNSTVMYVVQRMTQLMTLFSLAALICYLLARQRLRESPGSAIVLLILCLFPFGVLSVLSKENGALLLLQIVIIEWLFFRRAGTTPIFRLWFRVGILFPLIIIVAYLALNFPDSLALYETRPFNLGERLLTESRTLLAYTGEILVPSISGNGVFHDDFLISTNLFSPITTLVSCLLILFVLVLAYRLHRNLPVLSFAVFWFFSLHILESSFLPLELYFEHRNYLPMIGPLFCIAYYARVFLNSESMSNKYKLEKKVLAVVLIAFLLLSTSMSRISANIWSDGLGLHAYWAEQKPQSLRAQTTYAEYLNAIQQPELALQRLQLASRYYPDEVTLQLFIWNQACEYGLASPLSLSDIANNPELEYYRDDVNHHLGILIENLIRRRCDYPEQQVLISLFELIGQLTLSPPRLASFYVFYSDLYVYFGMLDPALINLSRSFEINPVPQLPIRQALLAASAGDLNGALIFLERAKLADRVDSPLLPSTMDEILRIEADIEAAMAAR